MTKLKKALGRTKQGRERGAALIITVVVVMLLTTLALTMAAFTVTEERTATTYRDALQTRQVAEAGVRVVQEMFRTPDDRSLVPLWSLATPSPATASDYWGATQTAVETQLNAIGIWRNDRTGASPSRYSGNDNRFFQGPFKESWEMVFGGVYSTTVADDRFDVKFNCRNPATGALIANANTKCWLDTKINALLLTPPALPSGKPDFTVETGKVTDITFYAPPTANGRAYGIATVRVTATKYDDDGTTVIARETLEAVIIDVNPKPAVLGNGDIIFKVHGGAMCGDGCEQIHANGNAVVGDITGGQNPMITATGTITGGSGSTKPSAKTVATPEINPWDLEYKPKLASELDKYYLLAARPLDAMWTDNDPTTQNPPRKCGTNLTARCQDYNLEYTAADVSRPRTAAMVPQMYKWNSAINGWTLCSSGNALSGGVGLACLNAPTFSVIPAADQPAAAGGAGDLNDLPFAKDRYPRTRFEIGSAQVGATVLVDGTFYKQGNMNTTMSVIAVGDIDLNSQTEWAPALSNKVMWISGRDIDTHANCCAPFNTCATNLNQPSFASIIAAHEQLKTGSQNVLLGVLIGENRVNYDPFVDSSLAIDSDNGDHGSLCNNPEWPWTMPVVPAIASMKTATN